MTRPFTGRHMAAILVTFFGVVILVNMVNAIYASRTFGGMVVENSYVASQKFNGWLAMARQQEALGWTLGWTLRVTRGPAHHIAALLNDRAQPVGNARISAVARHPLGRLPDRTLLFRATGDGRYESVAPLPPGRWILHVMVEAQGRTMRRIVDLP